MLKEITPKEFQDRGMIWYLNQQLHLFGMALAIETDEDGTQQIKPYECKFRGFDTDTNDRGYKKVTTYIENNIDRIKEDVQ